MRRGERLIIMRFVAPARVLIAGTVAVLSAVVWFGAETASACSCAIADPVVAIGNADAVFTGTLIDQTPVGPDNGYHYDWTFEVDGVVKGDVVSPQFVTGQEFGGGCGVNFTNLAGSVTVYAQRGDGLASIGCSPQLSAVDLQIALDEAAAESKAVGTGPPSALVVGETADANLIVLGSDGLPLARWQLPLDPTAVAHCSGTNRAAVWSQGPSVVQEDGPSVVPEDGPSLAGTTNVASIIDLETMEVVETREIDSEFVSIRDQFECLDGGRFVILSRGDGSDEGRVTVATSTSDGAGASQDFDGVTRAVIHPSGTVALLPRRPGQPIQTIAGPGLEAVGPASGVELGDGIAVVGGAFSPDGDRFAALVTSAGTEVQYDTDATGVLLLDVIDGVVQPAQGDPIAVPPHDGRARQIAWLDDELLVIEHETDDSKGFAVVTTDGDVVGSGDVGWGWGLTRLDGSILRSRDGGLELIDVDTMSTPLVPSPSDQFEDGWFFTAAIVDAPEMTLPSFAGIALTIRPFEQAPSDTVPGDPVPADPVGEPPASPVEGAPPVATGVDSGLPVSPDSLPTGAGSSMLPWGFTAIAGLIILGVAIWRPARRKNDEGRAEV